MFIGSFKSTSSNSTKPLAFGARKVVWKLTDLQQPYPAVHRIVLPGDVKHETNTGEISLQLTNGANQRRRETIDLLEFVQVIVHTVTNFKCIIGEVITSAEALCLSL